MTKGARLNSYALLQFQKKTDADQAITCMNNGLIDGSKIIVESQADANNNNNNNNRNQKPEKKRSSTEKVVKR